MKKVLFICTPNSACSPIAEALLKQSCGEFFHVESAGTQPGQLNSNALEVMAELGIDISKNQIQSIVVTGQIKTGHRWAESIRPLNLRK